MINMSIAKSEDEIAAEEIIKILETFFETDKHVLLTAPPGHGKTWVINRIYDIFKFQKLFDKHKEEILQLKEELKVETFQETFEETFDLLEQDEENSIDDDIKSIVDSYFGILRSVSGNHSNLHYYIVDYLEGYMSSNEISNQFNNGVIKIAPTGVAADNIQGMTYHSFFALNIFKGCQKENISNADSRIIKYLQNINGYGIANLLYGIPNGQEKIITNNENLFRVIHQEIIIFDEISMIYDLSIDLLWKLTHDLQDVVREIRDHFRNIRKYNSIERDNAIYSQIEKDIPNIVSWKQKQYCKKSGKIIDVEVKEDVSKIKSDFIDTIKSMDAINLMSHITEFFFKMIPEQLNIGFEIFHRSFHDNDIFMKMMEEITRKITKIAKRKHGFSEDEAISEDDISEQGKIRRYLENLCLRIVYDLFRNYFESNDLEIPYNIQLFYNVMKSCNNKYKFISNMKKIDSIKPIKFLFVGDFLQIQPFKDKDYKIGQNEIARYYLKPKRITDETVSLSLYKDINSFFSDIFAKPDNKIEKLTLTICQRQSEEETDFRNLILDMRLGKCLSKRSRELLESDGRIIKCTVDELLKDHIEDKNNLTILSMDNHYSEIINKSLILKDYTGDIDIVPNTLLRKKDISDKRLVNKYLDISTSAKNINDRISQLCYLSYFMNESSRGRFNIVLDNKQTAFLESFVDNLRLSIIQFFGDDESGARIYDEKLDELSKVTIRRYKIVEKIIDKNGKSSKIKKYKYEISKACLDKIRIEAYRQETHTIETLIDNLRDVRNDIEDEIYKILSNDKDNDSNLDKACIQFLNNIENSNDVITNFINDIKAMGKNMLSPEFNYDHEEFYKKLHKQFKGIITKYKNVNLKFKELCENFLDGIKYTTNETEIKTIYTDFISNARYLDFYKRTITLHKLKMKLTYYNNGIVYEKPIDFKIILPISENKVIEIDEFPIKRVRCKINDTTESSNINIFTKGMKCMVTKNKRSGPGAKFEYVNGSMGNFEEIDIRGRLLVNLKDRDDQNLRVNVFPDIEHQSGNFCCLQFPVVPAYSISINKSQGLTIPGKVILNLNQKGGGIWWRFAENKDWFFKLVVAISRCTKLENLIINRHIEKPSYINDLSDSDFIDYMFHNMYKRADPKSKLIFDIERNKKRCRRILSEMHKLRKKRKFDEWRRRT